MDTLGLNTFRPPGSENGEYISIEDVQIMLQAISHFLISIPQAHLAGQQYNNPAQGMGGFLEGPPSKERINCAQEPLEPLQRLAESISGHSISDPDIQTAERAFALLTTVHGIIVGVVNIPKPKVKQGGQPPNTHIVEKPPTYPLAQGQEAKSAIGFADDAVGLAYQGLHSGGGHAMRHLIDEDLISDAGSLALRAQHFKSRTSPILRHPVKTFDWKIGNTRSRAFVGQVDGKIVVVFVAKEGPYQGRVLSAIVPDAAQTKRWGL